MKGYLYAVDRCEIVPVYVEDPKREFIDIGDELLTEDSIGEVRHMTAVSPIHAFFEDEDAAGQLKKICTITGERHLPKLIGMVMIDRWYGNSEQEDEDAE